MIKSDKVRICITLDKYVYKKLLYMTNKDNFSLIADIVPSKSQFINDLIDFDTKFLELQGLVTK